MSAGDLVRAHEQGVAAARDPDAVNPYAPAPPDTAQERLAQMWMRGRLSQALPVPGELESDE